MRGERKVQFLLCSEFNEGKKNQQETCMRNTHKHTKTILLAKLFLVLRSNSCATNMLLINKIKLIQISNHMFISAITQIRRY